MLISEIEISKMADVAFHPSGRIRCITSLTRGLRASTAGRARDALSAVRAIAID
jgi:hypothetical protein